MEIPCRKDELIILDKLFQSKKPELLALYGRRRIGKTFLIREFFSKRKGVIFFNSTGLKEGSLSEQIINFTEEIGDTFLYQGAKLEVGKNWRETFRTLTDNIKAAPSTKKIILFFDEFPWMATKNSKLLQNLDYFWNQHWSKDSRIKLIICGSSASWIVNKIVHNKGGLHNRLTCEMALEPLNLIETKNFLKGNGVNLTARQVTNLYMITGGVPYYLLNIEKNLSAIQNIEQLAFKRKGILIEEFDKLFSSLFDQHDIYIEIMRKIAAHRYGIGQSELFSEVNNSLRGKSGLTKLDALIKSSFITSFKPMGHSSRGLYYKAIDEYTLFYLYWIEPIKEALIMRSMKRGYWEQQQNSSKWHAWSGYAFEAICYKHLAQISEALKLSPTAIPYTWRHIPKKSASTGGAQIDLLFDREDDAITICEIKHTAKPFIIDKAYAENLQRKLAIFKKITGTSKQLFLVMICANGLKKNKYSEELISGVVTLEDLFKRVD